MSVLFGRTSEVILAGTVTVPTVFIVLPLTLAFLGVYMWIMWKIVNWAFDVFGRWWFSYKGYGDYDEQKALYEEWKNRY